MSAAFQSWLAATRREVAELLPDVDAGDVLAALASLALRRLIESVESGSQAMLAALVVGELASIAAEPKASQRRMLVGLLVELLDRRTGESSIADRCAAVNARLAELETVPAHDGIAYHRVRHSGHEQYGSRVWDTEQWSVLGSWGDERPAGVPADAKRERGFMVQGQQFVVWERQVSTDADFDPSCQVCKLRALGPNA